MMIKKYETKNNQLKKDNFYSCAFYVPDEKFKANLEFKCMLLLPEDQKSGFFKFGFIQFIKDFSIPNPKIFVNKFTSVSLSVFMISGSIFYFNFLSPNLNSDFVLTQVYAENTQTNLMPFMMLSTGFNSNQNGQPKTFNPSFVPLDNKVKNYTYGHVGYQVTKGAALDNCAALYPFPEDLTRVEAYEYIGEEGKAHYKIFAIGAKGRINDFTLQGDGQLMKIDEDGTLSKMPLNVIKKEFNVSDIIGQLPKTISVRKQGWDHLVLSWEKKVVCDDYSQDDLLIEILVDRNNFKIKNITTHLNTETSESMVYSIDFVSNTKQYKYEDVKSTFEYQASDGINTQVL